MQKEKRNGFNYKCTKNIRDFKCMHIEISEITNTVVQVYSGTYPQKIWILPEPVFSFGENIYN